MIHHALRGSPGLQSTLLAGALIVALLAPAGGTFTLAVPAGGNHVSVERMGYASSRVPLSGWPGVIPLEPSPYLLERIAVEVRRGGHLRSHPPHGRRVVRAERLLDKEIAGERAAAPVRPLARHILMYIFRSCDPRPPAGSLHEATRNMAVFEVTDATFDEHVAKSEGVTVVDFWAPWCGPCRMVGPVMEELAEEYDGKVRFAKVNVDDSPETAGAFGIRSIPTIGFFRNGEPVGGVVGAYPKDALQQVIEDILAKQEDAA